MLRSRWWAAICAPWVPQGFSGVFILGFPQNKKTTRQQIKTVPTLRAATTRPNRLVLVRVGGLCITSGGFNR